MQKRMHRSPMTKTRPTARALRPLTAAPPLLAARARLVRAVAVRVDRSRTPAPAAQRVVAKAELVAQLLAARVAQVVRAVPAAKLGPAVLAALVPLQVRAAR